MDYATVVPCLLYTFDMRWYDSDNGDYCGKISVFLMKKQRLSATYLPQIARKRPKTTCFEPTFSQKRVIFCVNDCKSENICHTFLMLNMFI